MEEQEKKTRMGIATFEKRRNPRFLLDLPIEYLQVDSSLARPGRTGNASKGGLLVYLNEEPDIGQYLRVKLFFTLGRELVVVSALSEVVWINTYFGKEGDYQCGLRFREISPEDLQKLESFLDHLSRSQKL
ncbi:MAG: PilZ domain-containing protein [Deltaproteobacteria bacterium]|nr:PilZ domain-containing protein [Deltaproteobacteria bacterium]